MWFLELLLLVWFPGVLHAQRAAGSCARPELTDGFLVPDLQSYPHKNNVVYACNAGFKSVMDGWWGTSTCQNGKWFPEPFCIDENSCVPPEIPAGECPTTTGWFEENYKLRVNCNQGYRLESLYPLPQCIKGSWTFIPVCKKKSDACDRPSKISNATVIHEASQKVFPDGSRLRYECRKGHNIEEDKTEEFITCRGGQWTRAPPCSRVSPACVMKRNQYKDLKLRKDELFMEGDIKDFDCGYVDYVKKARCINSEIFLTLCCHKSYAGDRGCEFTQRS